MYDIIRSLVYKTRTNFVIKAVLIGAVALMFVTVTGLDDGVKLCGSQIVVFFAEVVIFLFFQSIIIGGIIIGSDFNDKTLNYEVMSGHSKSEIYFGRLIVAYVTAIIATVLALSVPAITISLIYGWGDVVSVKSYVFRVILTLVPLFKYIALMQMLCFFMKNYFAAMAVQLVITFVEYFSMLFAEFPDWLKNIFTVTSFNKVLGYSFAVDEQTGAIIYVDKISSGDMTVVVIVNLAMGFLFVLAGFIWCNKKDIEA